MFVVVLLLILPQLLFRLWVISVLLSFILEGEGGGT